MDISKKYLEKNGLKIFMLKVNGKMIFYQFLMIFPIELQEHLPKKKLIVWFGIIEKQTPN